jgi:hypothetical protein
MLPSCATVALAAADNGFGAFRGGRGLWPCRRRGCTVLTGWRAAWTQFGVCNARRKKGARPLGSNEVVMSARIFSPAKTAMQSGKAKTGHWVLEFDPAQRKKIDPLMGYTTSGDMLSQVKLTFETKEEAMAYADKEKIAYRVEEPKETKRRQISYSDNFRYDRRTPWTH